MGRKIKLKSDPQIAKPHATGSKVTLVQPALHTTYGVVMIPRPQYWTLHLRVAEARFGELRSLDERVLATPIDSSNSRVLDEELTVGLYHVGSEMILNTILAVHQLVLEIEVAAKIKPKPSDNLNDRLVRALRATGFTADLGKDPRYGQFAELQRVRDAIEHPQEDNIYNGEDIHWDDVPLAWIASGKALRAYSDARSLLEEIVAHWAEARKQYARPGDLQVQRGMKSQHAVKKPPRPT